MYKTNVFKFNFCTLIAWKYHTTLIDLSLSRVTWPKPGMCMSSDRIKPFRQLKEHRQGSYCSAKDIALLIKYVVPQPAAAVFFRILCVVTPNCSMRRWKEMRGPHCDQFLRWFEPKKQQFVIQILLLVWTKLLKQNCFGYFNPSQFM